MPALIRRAFLLELGLQIQAKELLKKAHEHLIKGDDLIKAENIFCDLYNDSVINKRDNQDVLLFYIASTHMKRGHDALSELLFKEAIKLRPNFVEAINNLGYINKQQGLREEAKKHFEKVLQLIETSEHTVDDKEKSDYVTNLGSLYIANGTPNKAIEILNKAIELNPDNIVAKWNRSLANLELGDYEKGFSEYDFGDRTERCKERYYGDPSIPFWDGTPGQTVVVYGEQGIGDELMFASMLPDIMKDCRVIFDAHPRLANMFRQTFPKIPIYGTRKAKELKWPKFHKIDAKIAIGSLGKFYRKNLSDFPQAPYLKADSLLFDKISLHLNKALGVGRPVIGISWQGGTKNTGVNNRIIPLEKWVPLFEALDADFISLQYTDTAVDEIKAFEDKYPYKIHHFQEYVDDYDLTAALVTYLDMVISVPQSVVHLAGALATPTFQFCPKKALWQMGVYGQDMPWYSSVKNYWQDASEKWEPVIQNVIHDLNTLEEKECSSAMTIAA
jgi:tetratricopeptide (TPR) repeat protein